MNSKNTLMRILDLNIRSLLTLLLTSSFAFAQGHHHHELEDKVKEVVKLTDKKIEISPEICPDPNDRAFVNFDPKHLNDPKGHHGMLFFGHGDSFYISHLPMFHPPHDYQAIVEVKMSPNVKAKYQAELARKGGYFTFNPDETFVLPKVLVEKKPIPGTFFQGHFERGGNPFLQGELELVRVVFYKKISAKDKKPEKERYVIFGDGKEYFMAHEIFQRPNVDEIIPLPKDFKLNDSLKRDIKNHGLTFMEDVEMDGKKVVSKKNNLEFPYQEFYRETGDLE